MDNMIVVVCDSESQAFEILREINLLNFEGSIELYSAAIVHKNEKQIVRIHDHQDSGPIGTVIGMSVGGLLGALAGPAGLAAGLALGGAAGAYADFYNHGVGAEFIADVSAHLKVGCYAVVAEAFEDATGPLDQKVSDVHGKIFRTPRAIAEDDLLSRKADEAHHDLEDIQHEMHDSIEHTKAKLKTGMQTLKGKIDAARNKANEVLHPDQRHSPENDTP